MPPEIIAGNLGLSELNAHFGPEAQFAEKDPPITTALLSLAGGLPRKWFGNLALMGFMIASPLSVPTDQAGRYNTDFSTVHGVSSFPGQTCRTVPEVIGDLCSRRPEKPIGEVACAGGYTTVEVAPETDPFGVSILEWTAADALTGQITTGQCTNPDGSPMVPIIDQSRAVDTQGNQDSVSDFQFENGESRDDDRDWLAIVRNGGIILGLLAALKLLVPMVTHRRRR